MNKAGRAGAGLRECTLPRAQGVCGSQVNAGQRAPWELVSGARSGSQNHSENVNVVNGLVIECPCNKSTVTKFLMLPSFVAISNPLTGNRLRGAKSRPTVTPPEPDSRSVQREAHAVSLDLICLPGALPPEISKEEKGVCLLKGQCLDCTVTAMVLRSSRGGGQRLQ